MLIGWMMLFSSIIFLIVIVLLWDRRHSDSAKARCVHCQSIQLVETERSTFGNHPIRFIGGGLKPDAAVRVQRNIEVRYRCRACGKEFSRRTVQMS